MKLNIDGREISSRDFSAVESAWDIEDAAAIIEYFKRNNKIILGGDILTDKLEHSYDSWYYDLDHALKAQTNIDRSAQKASDYISKYIKKNGTAFYVIFVVE